MPRRVIALAAAAAVVAIAVLAVLLTRGDDKQRTTPTTPADTRAEALAYAPTKAPALVAMDTGSPGASLVLGAVVPAVSGGALTANDVSALLGNEGVVALLDPRTRRAQISLVARDQDALRALARKLTKNGSYRGAQLYSGPNGSAVAIRDATLVAASDTATVKRALDVRADPTRHPTPAQFDNRLQGLARTADVRAVFDPRRVVVATRLPQVLRTRWGRALRDGAAVLTTTADGTALTLPFRLRTDPGVLTTDDLPFATGPQTPQIHGRQPLLLGVRDLARLLAFLRVADPDLIGGLDALQRRLPSFLRLNIDGLLDGLTNDGTIGSSDGLAHFAARTDPPDPDAWHAPLSRLSTLSSVLQSLGIDDIELDEEAGDAYRLRVDDDFAARVGIFGPTLVITDDPRVNVRAEADAPAAATPPGAAGGLTVRLEAREARRLLTTAFGIPAGAAVLLDRLRDLTGWARAERDGVNGELRLGVG